MRWDQLDFAFPEFGPPQSLDHLQIAFGNLFVLYVVTINVYAKLFQIISMVQTLGLVSFFRLFRIWPKYDVACPNSHYI